MLAFKDQNCELTLAEGLEIYLSYLKENNKKIGTDGSDAVSYTHLRAHETN